MNDLNALYQDLIIDHNRHPHHFGEMAHATHTAWGVNPICGDDVKVFLKITDHKIEQIQFTGDGCAIAIASSSLMSDALTGKSIQEAEALFSRFHQMMTNPSQSDADLGKLQVLGNVINYPMRIKCATLAWHTFKAALANASAPITTEKDHE